MQDRPAFELVIDKGPPAQRQGWLDRLAALRDRFGGVLAVPPADPRLRIVLTKDAQEFQKRALEDVRVEPRGIGCRDGDRGVLVLHADAKLVRNDETLARLVAHEVTHLLLARLPPAGPLADSWGSFEEGLAHWFEAELGLGICECLCYAEHAQPPLRFRGGRWRDAALALDQERRLPALADLVDREIQDLDPEQHVAAFAFVDYLVRGAAAPPITGAAARPEALLLRLARPAKTGQGMRATLAAVLGRELAELDELFRLWVRATYC